jgi:hypothetical protein
MARGSTYFVGSSTPVWQARIIPRVERVQPPKEHGRRRAWQWLGGERASLPPALPRPDARPEKTVIDPRHTRQLGRHKPGERCGGDGRGDGLDTLRHDGSGWSRAARGRTRLAHLRRDPASHPVISARTQCRYGGVAQPHQCIHRCSSHLRQETRSCRTGQLQSDAPSPRPPRFWPVERARQTLM